MISFEIATRDSRGRIRLFTIKALDVDSAAMQAVDDVEDDETVVNVRQGDVDMAEVYAAMIFRDALENVLHQTAEEVMDRDG